MELIIYWKDIVDVYGVTCPIHNGTIFVLVRINFISPISL